MFSALSRGRLSVFSLLLGLTMLSGEVQAKNFVGYTGKRWNSDFGVLRGECNVKDLARLYKKGTAFTDTALLELDAAAQALLTSSTRNEVADLIDTACFGQTLELVPSGQAVRWLNSASGVGVYLSPGAKSDSCRTYLGVLAVSGQKTKFRGEACSPTPGVWRIQP